MTDADLIAEYIANHGVTVCPPCKCALPPVESWDDLKRRGHAVLARKRKFEAARQRAAQIASGGRRVRSDVDTADIIDAARDGKTTKQIADMFAMTDHAVTMRLRRLGLNITTVREDA